MAKKRLFKISKLILGHTYLLNMAKYSQKKIGKWHKSHFFSTHFSLFVVVVYCINLYCTILVKMFETKGFSVDMVYRTTT